MPESFAIFVQTTLHDTFNSGARHYVILLRVKPVAAYVDSHWSVKLTWYLLQSADTRWSTIHIRMQSRDCAILRLCGTYACS